MHSAAIKKQWKQTDCGIRRASVFDTMAIVQNCVFDTIAKYCTLACVFDTFAMVQNVSALGMHSVTIKKQRKTLRDDVARVPVDTAQRGDVFAALRENWLPALQ